MGKVLTLTLRESGDAVNIEPRADRADAANDGERDKTQHSRLARPDRRHRASRASEVPGASRLDRLSISAALIRESRRC